jgi:2-keto-4-pentenoate hydratase/2-oxohepta-3-ene-1,7-dioic acid hydratase in catechol pathway
MEDALHFEHAFAGPDGGSERPGKIVAIGHDYMDHVRETVTQRVDWEVELAAVIGRPVSRVPAEEALDHLRGYTVANDVSARDVQFSDGQRVGGKSLDTFCPLEFMDPVRSLQHGDVVEVEVDGIGTLRNPVADLNR